LKETSIKRLLKLNLISSYADHEQIGKTAVKSGTSSRILLTIARVSHADETCFTDKRVGKVAAVVGPFPGGR